MIDPGRLRRAIHLDATPIDINAFLVSGGAENHTVNVVDGTCVCDCFDAHIHGDGCKHSLVVRLLGGEEEVVKALRRIVPRKAKALPPPSLAKVP